MSWATEELASANLGDSRRNQRLIKIVEDLAGQPETSVVQASRDEAALEGMYHFWSSPYIKPERIIEAHIGSAIKRIEKEEMVLAIQDTTELDFKSHIKKKGMGKLSNPYSKGMMVHTVLCSSTRGVPLGVIHQSSWARNKKEKETKESYRWIEALEKTEREMPEKVKVVTITDREGDFYELLSHSRREGSEWLIRAFRKRKVKLMDGTEEIKPLKEAITSTEIRGRETVKIQRGRGRKDREVKLEIRYESYELQPPENSKNEQPLKVQVILAQEEGEPLLGEEKVEWLLLTTLTIENIEDARKYLQYYAKRWLIERFHYVLKSGCYLEKLQLERRERIQRALATYSIVAWRILWITYEARENPEKEVEGILEKEEWQALYGKFNKGKPMPLNPPKLGECVLWIAKMGGYLARKGIISFR